MTTTPKVYESITKVAAALAHRGIAKDQKNTQGSGYYFRGIDSVYNALAPLLAEHNLCILPKVLTRDVVERTSKSGGALFYVTIQCDFDIVSSIDGSKHTVSTFGEAMDSGDKATNKAMSAAYKYMAIQSFAIPTEGDNDADSTTHEVARATKKTESVELAPNLLAQALEDLSCADNTERLRVVFATAWKASAGDDAARNEIQKAYQKNPHYVPKEAVAA